MKIETGFSFQQKIFSGNDLECMIVIFQNWILIALQICFSFFISPDASGSASVAKMIVKYFRVDELPLTEEVFN